MCERTIDRCQSWQRMWRDRRVLAARAAVVVCMSVCLCLRLCEPCERFFLLFLIISMPSAAADDGKMSDRMSEAGY